MSAHVVTPVASSLAPLVAWTAIKNQLRRELGEKEWEGWIRHARLMRHSEARGKYCAGLLVCMPRNGSVIFRGMRHQPKMNRLARKLELEISLCVQPNDGQVEQWRVEKDFQVTYLEPAPSELWRQG